MPQTTDLLNLTCPFDTNSFSATALAGAERLSHPFRYELTLEGGKEPIDAGTALDAPVTILIGTPGTGAVRQIKGIVAGLSQESSANRQFWQCRLTIVPKLWFLTQTRACRIYNSKSAIDIVKQVLSLFEVTPVLRTTESYAALPYVIQYNESYFDFFQRIIEENGLFYFFETDDSGCNLVIADGNTAFRETAPATVDFVAKQSGSAGLDTWSRDDTTALGTVRLDDYNPETVALAPGTIQGQVDSVLTASAKAQRTFYGWPGLGTDATSVRAHSKQRIEGAEAAALLYAGSGRAPQLYAGGKFSLENKIANTAAAPFVVQSLTLRVSDPKQSRSAPSLETQCVAFPADKPWREQLSVPRPVMAGVFSAKVIGPTGEEIFTDKLGRIQVEFPWDSQGDIKAENTIWVRVLQPWAGNNWGVQFVPRVGMEVGIAFLEGDANRPVAVGALYNSENAPVFSASEKNKTGWRTRSTKDGGTANFNEYSFDDTKGSEQVFLHAERDHKIEIENDETLTIGGKQTETITGNRTVTIQQGNDALTLDQGNRSVKLTLGNDDLNAEAGQISREALQSISLTVGPSSIKITPEGITLSAPMITLTGTALIKAGAPAIQVQGDADVQITSGGQMMINGALIMIN